MNIADQVEQMRLNQTRLNIEHYCKEHQRSPDKIHLLAVSKTHPAARIQEAYAAGITEFGESYLQEALEKIKVCKHLPIIWHFIGPLQSNKTRAIAENFDWVQSVDNQKNLVRLNNQRPEHLAPLQICIQVNLFAESQKKGITPDLLPQLLAMCEQMPHIKLRGLMVIPPKCNNFAEQHQQFKQAADLYEQVKLKHHNIDTLSMGMSNDMAAAISAGSTMLRIGTGIFGVRGNQVEQ